MPTTEDFRAAIRAKLAAAEAEGKAELLIRSGDLHHELGGYPGADHQMPVCCDAMRKEMGAADEVVRQPPSGKGANLFIRYVLPRSSSPIFAVFGPGGASSQKHGGMRAIIQHATARQALPIISQQAKAGGQLTYQSLALKLGRDRKDARAVAQVCDLLDCAATLARRPLMALWTVRDAAGNINPDAWVKDTLPGLRDALIAEAEAHTFSDEDERAMRNALDQLTGMGNRKAWVHVREVISQDEMLACLRGRELRQMDSINDLGTDEPPIVPTSGKRYVRDPAVREAVLHRANGACEFCGAPGFQRADGSRYLECHHIIALSNDGQDRMTNVIALCPGHHREAHFGAQSAEMEKRMVVLVRQKEAANAKG